MQILETIYLKNGQLQNIDYHNHRLNEAGRDLFKNFEKINLVDLIKIPDEFKTGDFRCRILYEEEIKSINFIKYSQKEIRRIKIIDIKDWDYKHKFADRSFFNQILEDNQHADEVIMTKNGLITDCTIANLAFYDGSNWFTPSTPLLRGTKRQQLLDKQIITERKITIEDIYQYQGVCLINCFRDLELNNLVSLTSTNSDL